MYKQNEWLRAALLFIGFFFVVSNIGCEEVGNLPDTKLHEVTSCKSNPERCYICKSGEIERCSEPLPANTFQAELGLEFANRPVLVLGFSRGVLAGVVLVRADANGSAAQSYFHSLDSDGCFEGVGYDLADYRAYTLPQDFEILDDGCLTDYGSNLVNSADYAAVGNFQYPDINISIKASDLTATVPLQVTTDTGDTSIGYGRCRLLPVMDPALDLSLDNRTVPHDILYNTAEGQLSNGSGALDQIDSFILPGDYQADCAYSQDTDSGLDYATTTVEYNVQTDSVVNILAEHFDL